jgi:hypothetical protein
MQRTGISPPVHDRTPRRRTAAYENSPLHIDVEARPRASADFVWDYGSSFVSMRLSSSPNANISRFNLEAVLVSCESQFHSTNFISKRIFKT